MIQKKKVVIFTGAGISKESGLDTFRDSDGSGMWGKHNIKEVCTSDAWDKNPQNVNDFYNDRRSEVIRNKPNKAHYDLVNLEKYFDVTVITTNIDNYHERAGSSNVLHLHGEILKARSSNPKYDWMGLSHDFNVNNPELINVGLEGLNINRDIYHDGYPLRPFVVFFGESVPNISKAEEIVKHTDYFVIIGSSLSVPPSSNLMFYLPESCLIYRVDPNLDDVNFFNDFVNVNDTATIGTEVVCNLILKNENILK